MVTKIIPNIVKNFRTHDWLRERAILAAQNTDVSDINVTVLNNIPDEIFTYKSVDSVTNQYDVVNYQAEFLNSLDLPRLTSHRIQAKVGESIILLRNISQPRLCNETRSSSLKGKY